MCWNAPISFATLIIGTLLNIWLVYKIREPIIYALALFWQWVILMQLYEGVYWIKRDNNDWTSKMANITSILQPVVLIVLLLLVPNQNTLAKSISVGILILYISYILYQMTTLNNFKSLEPTKSCSHLNINWGENKPSLYLAYLITVFTGFILLVKPVKFMMIITSYVALALLVSVIFYSCGTPSMWCWFAALAPLITYFAWKLTHPINSPR